MTHICLTDKGRNTTEKLYDMAIEANRSFLSALTHEETYTLKGLFSKVRGTA